jgi:hypothetical protein
MLKMSSSNLLARKPGGAGAIGQQHRELSSGSGHTTFPTSVASDRLYHGLFSGRLGLALRSMLYSRQDSNLGCSETIMWDSGRNEVWHLSCQRFDGFLGCVGWGTMNKNRNSLK